MQKLLAILVDGTIYFSWLFIVSIGLTLIYGVMKILNIAHGSFYALGAYTAASAVGAYFAGNYPAAGSFLLLIAAGVVVAEPSSASWSSAVCCVRCMGATRSCSCLSPTPRSWCSRI